MQYPTIFTITLIITHTFPANATTIAPELLRPPPGVAYLLEDPAPVTIRFAESVSPAHADELIKMGVEPVRLPSGRLASVGPVLAASLASLVSA